MIPSRITLILVSVMRTWVRYAFPNAMFPALLALLSWEMSSMWFMADRRLIRWPSRAFRSAGAVSAYSPSKVSLVGLFRMLLATFPVG